MNSFLISNSIMPEQSPSPQLKQHWLYPAFMYFPAFAKTQRAPVLFYG
jgi:hypothetical protein